MNFNDRLVLFLRCPFCAGGVGVKKVYRPDRDDGIESGVLECRACAFDFPVIEGIPIIMAPHESVDSKFEKNGMTTLAGPKVYELTEAVKSGEPVRALSLLFDPSELDGDWLLPLPAPGSAVSPDWREPVTEGGRSDQSGTRLQRFAQRAPRRGKTALARFVLPHARLRFADYLKNHGSSLSALDAMDLFYRRYSGSETFNSFAFRFGQPRHLAALSLALLLDDRTEPVLDVACGVGHVMHYLTSVRPTRLAIGLDRDFVQLWIASRFVSPGGLYVCAPPDAPLPFSDHLFGGVFCSGAFHCFLHRAGSAREMRRVMTAAGALVLARLRNAAVESREGYELSVESYERLFEGLPLVFLGEDELVKKYVDRRGPDLGGAESSEELSRQNWLSVVASAQTDLFGRGKRIDRWPHAVGTLRLNPSYVIEEKTAAGDLVLRFEFPSDRYKFESHAYTKYAPERCVLPAAVARALERGERPPELEEYIRQFVILGMPERYSRPSCPAHPPKDAEIVNEAARGLH